MKTAFTCLFLLVAVPLARAQQSTPDKSPLAIEVSIVRDSLPRELFRRGGDFRVQTKITNISGEKQTITVWSQPGWSWLADSPLVHPDTNANQNVSETRVLRPGEVYGEDVGMHFYPRDRKPVTFRLGFFPKAKLPVSGRPDAIPTDQIFWSNAVRLTP